MYPELQQLESELASALRGLEARHTQLTPSTAPRKWSIQQIVEHLLATYRGSTTAIQARIDKRSGTRARATLGQKCAQFVFFRLGISGSRKAPAAVAPGLPLSVQTGAELAERIHDELTKMDATIARGEHLFADRQAVAHIILGPLSMLQWRQFHLLHGKRHVRQIRAIRRDHGL